MCSFMFSVPTNMCDCLGQIVRRIEDNEKITFLHGRRYTIPVISNAKWSCSAVHHVRSKNLPTFIFRCPAFYTEIDCAEAEHNRRSNRVNQTPSHVTAVTAGELEQRVCCAVHSGFERHVRHEPTSTTEPSCSNRRKLRAAVFARRTPDSTGELDPFLAVSPF